MDYNYDDPDFSHMEYMMQWNYQYIDGVDTIISLERVMEVLSAT